MSVAAFLLKNPFMRGTWLARRESCTHVQCRGLKRKHVGQSESRGVAAAPSHSFMLTLHLLNYFPHQGAPPGVASERRVVPGPRCVLCVGKCQVSMSSLYINNTQGSLVSIGVTVLFLSFWGTFPIGYVSYCISMYFECILMCILMCPVHIHQDRTSHDTPRYTRPGRPDTFVSISLAIMEMYLTLGYVSFFKIHLGYIKIRLGCNVS